MPLPHDITELCQSAVHRGWLYIITRTSSEMVVFRSMNKHDWESFPSPPDTLSCQGMLSHNDRLFILSRPKKSVDQDEHLSILELLDIDGSLEWHKLPNARCPVERLRPAFFGAGNSLILAGGQSSAKPWPRTCSEYYLHGNDWVTTTSWPALFKEVSGLQSVTFNNCVHLIGGYDDALTPSNTTFSVDLRDGKPTSDWTGTTNALPVTPNWECGACHVHGNLVVAGGYDQSLKVLRPDVFVFDRLGSARWLQIPELTIARRGASLVFFRGSLLAICGGVNTSLYFSSAVEELSLTFISD